MCVCVLCFEINSLVVQIPSEYYWYYYVLVGTDIHRCSPIPSSICLATTCIGMDDGRISSIVFRSVECKRIESIRHWIFMRWRPLFLWRVSSVCVLTAVVWQNLLAITTMISVTVCICWAEWGRVAMPLCVSNTHPSPKMLCHRKICAEICVLRVRETEYMLHANLMRPHIYFWLPYIACYAMCVFGEIS